MEKNILLLVFCFGYSLSYSQNENNTCADATAVVAGSYVVTAVNGTQVPAPICAGNGAGTAGEWYKYQPTQNYTVTVTTDLAINTCGDTRLHIYTGSCASLSCLTGDDDAGIITCSTNSNNSYLSTVTFTANAGTTYYIAFDNRWKSDGFTFQVIEQPFVAPPISFTTETIATTSTICCVSDMNGDYLDDIVTVQANQVTVLTQKAVGGYTTTTYPLSATVNLPDWSIAAGDFDRNGFNDLVLGNASRVTVLKADATGTGYTIMAYPQSIFTQRTNFIDINNDGHLDLWACHDVAQSHAYRNDGAGNLIFDISLMPTLAVGGNYATMWTDYDNDGDQDMYLAKCRGGAPVGDPQRINLLYTNNRINPSPTGTTSAFTENGAAAGVNDGSQSWSTAIEDFDNDGDMDFLLSNISDTNKLYKNNGNGTFTNVYSTTGIAPQVGSWEIQAHDFNNDGFTDFLWQNGKELYINNGNLTFTGYDLPFSEGAIGDLNNDGFLDLQYSNKVYYNVPNANKWISIKLQGIQSNRNGIGARVELYGAWGKQIRDIRSGTGFSHQSTLNAHFGIGTENAITKVVVKWPSGAVDVINNPTINQSLLVVENSSTLGVAAFTNENFAVYPNPANDILNIKVKTEITVQTIKIFDLTGKLVLKPEIKNECISIQSLNKGTYFLLVSDVEGKNYAQKFIKE